MAPEIHSPRHSVATFQALPCQYPYQDLLKPHQGNTNVKVSTMSYDPTLNHHRASRSLHTDSPTPQTDSWDNTPQQSHYTTHSIPSGNQSEHHLSSQSPDTPTNAPQQIPFITPTDETHEGVAPLKSLPSFDQDAEAFRHDNVMRTVYENTQNAMEWLFGDAEWMWEKALNSKERFMPESERCSEAWRISMWGHLRDD